MRCFSRLLVFAILVTLAAPFPAADVANEPRPALADPPLAPRAILPGEDSPKPPVADEQAANPDMTADPTAVDPPYDELAERRNRHQDLIDRFPAVGMGAIDERWQRALGVAEDAQKQLRAVEDEQRLAADQGQETLADAHWIEREASFEDALLVLDQLLDRTENDGDLLAIAKKLDGHDDLAQRGGKAKQLAGVRERLIAAVAKAHALQREALALRHHAASVQAQADAKDREADDASSSIEEARGALIDLGRRIDEAVSPAPPQDADQPAPGSRHF